MTSKSKGYDKKTDTYLTGYHFSNEGMYEVSIVGNMVSSKSGKQRLNKLSIESKSRD